MASKKQLRFVRPGARKASLKMLNRDTSGASRSVFIVASIPMYRLSHVNVRRDVVVASREGEKMHGVFARSAIGKREETWNRSATRVNTRSRLMLIRAELA